MIQSGVYYALKGKVSILTISNKPVNSLTLSLRQGLNIGIDQAIKDKSKSIIICGNDKQFSNGIDLIEYTRKKHLISPNLNDIIKKIDNLNIPIIANINGNAIGSGLELALACHWRLATSNSKFSFPQVNLGLIPCNGGTQRLLRLIGLKNAIDLIISGRDINANEALKLGLIDSIIDQNNNNNNDNSIILDKVIEFAQSDEVLNTKLSSRQISLKSINDSTEFLTTLKKKIESNSKGYVAPIKIFNAITEAIKCNNFDHGLNVEQLIFEELEKHYQSKALQYFYLNEQRISNKNYIQNDDNNNNQNDKINTIGIIGGGTMGQGIAMSAANANIPTFLLETSKEKALMAIKNIENTYKMSSAYKLGKMNDKNINELLSRITPIHNIHDIKDVDLVIEAVYENMNTKKQIFSELDKIVKKNTILATNTSALDIDEIANSTSLPSRVIGTHFFSPANIMKLLEVIKGKETLPSVIQSSMLLAKRMNKIPILAGNCYGFIGNRMLDPYCREAHYLVEDGASPLQIDNVLKKNIGFAMGPFEMLDMAGNDIGYRQRMEMKALNINHGIHSELADKICLAGYYGQKSGKGWYLYDPNKPRIPLKHENVDNIIIKHRNDLNITVKSITDDEIIERTLYPLINEGMKILEDNIAERPEDIDIVYVYGYGFPKYRGGPMWWAEREIGLAKILTSIKSYYNKYPDKIWWKPSKLLEDIVAGGSTIREELYFQKKSNKL